MNHYQNNLLYLCNQKGISVTELENEVYIPKVRILEPTPIELAKIAQYFGHSLDTLVLHDLKSQESIDKSKIKLVILDVDGTMTDGGMYFTENGDQIKKYNTKDGLAIQRRGKEGLLFGIISHGRKEKLIKDRAELLGIELIYVGTEPKLVILKEWLVKLQLSLENVAFIGDDINDLDIIQAVGYSACPSDATEKVKQSVNLVLSKDGGKGCIREFLDNWL